MFELRHRPTPPKVPDARLPLLADRAVAAARGVAQPAADRAVAALGPIAVAALTEAELPEAVFATPPPTHARERPGSDVGIAAADRRGTAGLMVAHPAATD